MLCCLARGSASWLATRPMAEPCTWHEHGYESAWAPGGAKSRAIAIEHTCVPALPTRQGLPLRSPSFA